METREAYNLWAAQYDTNKNRTRDLEALALREILPERSYQSCLEIGCGTGKNTQWLTTRAATITAVDLSEEMLSRAQQKITSDSVRFVQADICAPWSFGNSYDLVTFSLVLEHIADLEAIFKEVNACLLSGGHVYVGELHPYKQYAGTRARFDTEQGRQEVPCFDHHISAFIQAAEAQGLKLVTLNEFFDDDARTSIPRILAIVFNKPAHN